MIIADMTWVVVNAEIFFSVQYRRLLHFVCDDVVFLRWPLNQSL